MRENPLGHVAAGQGGSYAPQELRVAFRLRYLQSSESVAPGYNPLWGGVHLLQGFYKEKGPNSYSGSASYSPSDATSNDGDADLLNLVLKVFPFAAQGTRNANANEVQLQVRDRDGTSSK